MKNFYYLLLGLVLFTACESSGTSFPEGEVIGYRPVYASEVELGISFETARTPVSTGKIFLQGDILLLSEVNEGVHIIDNSDPTNPLNRGFVVVKGNTDMSVKDDLLYVNQFTDIVAIDFSDLANIREVSRETSAFSLSEPGQVTPPASGFYFECPDPSKGVVLDWQLVTITNPKCYQP